jgi:hypothetical protein
LSSARHLPPHPAARKGSGRGLREIWFNRWVSPRFVLVSESKFLSLATIFLQSG